MTRVHRGVGLVVVTVALLGAAPARAQYRFPDPTVLVGPGASIGVRVRDLTSDDLTSARLDSQAGVFVESVVPGTPAEKAGIKAGDVILEFDGERVRSVRGLTRLVSETPPQRTVKAVVVRDGSRRTLDVTPERDRFSSDDVFRLNPGLPMLKPRGDLPLPQLPQGRLRYRGFIGVTLDPIAGQMADYFGVSGGVLVSGVDLGSAASRAGLKAGDVITAAHGQLVKQPSDVSAAVRDVRPGSKLELKIVRDRKDMTIAVDVPLVVPMLL
jgi:serine protease Do